MNTQSPAHLQQQVQARLLHQQRAQQLAHQQQQQQRDQHAAAQAAHAAARDGANAPGGVMEQLPDGGEQGRAAKRRKPTDRSLPTFAPSAAAAASTGPTNHKLAPSTAALESLSDSYSRLQAAERRLDWTVSRRKVDLAELIGAGPGGAGRAGVNKTLRINLITTIKDQSWQVDQLKPVVEAPAPAETEADPDPAPAPEEDATAPPAPAEGETEPKKDDDDGAMAVDSAAPPAEPKPDAADAPAPTTEAPPAAKPDQPLAVPRVELAIGGDLLGQGGERNPFSAFVKRVVVETDRDPALYDLVGPIDWQRNPSAAPIPGLSLSIPADQPFTATVSFYLSHTPERFALVPALAELLDAKELDRVGVLEKLWAYAKREGLVTETGVKCDGQMRKLFSNQAAVPFHHLPEYVNRFLGPLPPVVIKVPVTVAKPEGAEEGTKAPVKTTKAYDVEVGVEDQSRAEMEAVQDKIRHEEQGVGREVAGLDEKIALSAASSRSSLAKRDFLAQFASSPAEFLDRFLASQSADLSLLLQNGGERGAQSAVGGEGSWREAARHAGYWQPKAENGELGTVGWVDEAAGVWARREVEGKIRKTVTAAR